MNDRGLTLVEILVAGAAAAIILLGAGAFYLSTLRAVDDSHSQTFLQRQGTLILEELGRQVRPATSLNIVNASSPPGTCMDGIVDLAPGTDVLALDNGTNFCFYRNSAGRLMECRFTGGTCNSMNLLSGSPVPLTATAFAVRLMTPCEAAGGTCDGSTGLCANPSNSCAVAPAAGITFTLSDGTNAPLAFGVTLTIARHS